MLIERPRLNLFLRASDLRNCPASSELYSPSRGSKVLWTPAVGKQDGNGNGLRVSTAR